MDQNVSKECGEKLAIWNYKKVKKKGISVTGRGGP
jgi:hypothetical protein